MAGGDGKPVSGINKAEGPMWQRELSHGDTTGPSEWRRNVAGKARNESYYSLISFYDSAHFKRLLQSGRNSGKLWTEGTKKTPEPALTDTA